MDRRDHPVELCEHLVGDVDNQRHVAEQREQGVDALERFGAATGSTRAVCGGVESTELNLECTTYTASSTPAAKSAIRASTSDAALAAVGMSPMSVRAVARSQIFSALIRMAASPSTSSCAARRTSESVA